MKNLIIFGSGDHAKVLFWELIDSKKYKILGFFDDTKIKEKTLLIYRNKNYRLFTNYSKIKNISKLYGLIGIGTGKLRKKVLIKTKKANLKITWDKFLSKNCIIKKNVSLKEGCMILSGSHINANSSIGKHVLVNSSCNIEHDNVIGDFVTLSPCVVTAGNINIGEGSYIGLGSKILNNIKIEKEVLVGAGSLVNQNLKEKFVYFGHPTKKIRKVNKDDKL